MVLVVLVVLLGGDWRGDGWERQGGRAERDVYIHNLALTSLNLQYPSSTSLIGACSQLLRIRAAATQYRGTQN